jgi:hypothetical protein
MQNKDRERIERDIDCARSFLESVEGLNVHQPRDRLDRLLADGLAALIAAALDAGATRDGVRTTLLTGRFCGAPRGWSAALAAPTLNSNSCVCFFTVLRGL